MTGSNPSEKALVVFMKALAIATAKLDEIDPEDRSSENFVGDVDLYLAGLVAEAEKEGENIRDAVESIRIVLEQAFQAVSLLKVSGTPH